MTELQITIEADGSVRFVDKPQLRDFPGERTRERASHITPVNRLLRVAFRLLRAHTRDNGPVAALTRRWPCRWQVEIVGGPRFGSYADRQAAIDAEVRWLNENRL